MFTPPGDNEMPPLVDNPNPPFIPPPHGATNGGQPGFFDAFPGARAGGSSYPTGPGGASAWAPPQSTPYPTFNQQPLASPWGGNPPPLSAPAGGGAGGYAGPPPWHYGAYTPATTPGWGPGPVPNSAPAGGGGNAPGSPWVTTPGSAGGWGPSAGGSAAGWGAAGGGSAWGAAAGDSAWGASPASAGAGGSAWGAGGGGNSAWGGGGGSHPGTPFASATGQPVTGGWFGTSGGGGGGGNGGWGSAAGGGDGWGTAGDAWGTGPGGAADAWGTSGDEGWGDWAKEQDRKGKKKHSDSMKRSNSQGPSTRRSSSMHRSSSWGNVPDWVKAQMQQQQQYGGGGGYASGSATPNTNPNAPPYAQGDYYDQNNLARRPRDWRADYVPSGRGLASYIPNLGRSRSVVKEIPDPVRRQIHPLVDYETLKPALYYDLRTTRFNPGHLEFFRLDRPHNQVDLMQLATIPAAPFIRIMHPKLPWYVDIHPGQPNGVTIQDIFVQLHAQLHSPIHGRHFWNEELSEGDRIEITRAFQERVKSDTKGLVKRGILQVDFLGKKFILEGFVRGQKGIWEMKTGKAEE